MCNIWCWSYRQKRIGLGYSALCRQICHFLCLWYLQESGPTLQIASPSLARFCLHHDSYPEKNKNLYNYNRVPSTTGPRKYVCLHTHSLSLGLLTKVSVTLRLHYHHYSGIFPLPRHEQCARRSPAYAVVQLTHQVALNCTHEGPAHQLRRNS